MNLAEVVEFCESVAAKLENAVNMALDEESSANADESNEVFLEVSGGVDDTTDHSEAVVRGLGIVESDDTEKDEAASVVGRVDSDCEGSVIVRIADADVYVEASKPDDGERGAFRMVSFADDANRKNV